MVYTAESDPLCYPVDLPFNAEVLDREHVIEAMIESFAGSEPPLATLILDIFTEP
ncbi:hypothetical protein ACU8KI_03650 [Rhizobium leguminosarum]|uniref:hypothetical protein n=1 Tax=Rhizobium leguminosarum TaxID=384 RepID=UPI001AE6F9C9|nr:hypothetical protein [Rhizobium leguminosarum]MBP2486273.1 hypothetical protein [Rhizobium leguminosarum]